MPETDATIFIDANQYLELYRVTEGKKLLDPLKEQKEYIFVTTQIVDEVQRNKLFVAADFLTRQFEKLKVRQFNIPDHLFDTKGDTAASLRKKLVNIGSEIEKVNTDLRSAAIETLERISRSEDEVSIALNTIFQKATSHAADEMERARDRKGRGNPPGKKAGPLGDQLNWEQLLSHFKTKQRLWIITGDSDFCTKHSGNTFLNAFLYQDLLRTHDAAPEVHCFDSMDEGIRHFVESTGVKAEKLPTPEESKAIKEELESLPPMGWLDSSYRVSNYAAIQRHWNQQWSPAYFTNVMLHLGVPYSAVFPEEDESKD